RERRTAPGGARRVGSPLPEQRSTQSRRLLVRHHPEGDSRRIPCIGQPDWSRPRFIAPALAGVTPARAARRRDSGAGTRSAVAIDLAQDLSVSTPVSCSEGLFH